jgi:uncharacterized membrane protein YcaP (DUF421 family)
MIGEWVGPSMDPLRIVIRVVFAYVVLLVLMRFGGKRIVTHASLFDLTLAVLLGDLVDDVLWAEVQAGVFVVAAGTIVLVHTGLDFVRFRAAAWK